MSGKCSSARNTFIRYRENACLPTTYWNTAATYAIMSCDTVPFPRRVTVRLYSDSNCATMLSTETFDNNNNGLGQSCKSTALGPDFAATCFAPDFERSLSKPGFISTFTPPGCQTSPTLQYGVTAWCSLGEKILCEQTTSGTSLFRYTYQDDKCLGASSGKTELGVVGQCSGTNLTSSCPVSCYGVHPEDPMVCSGRGNCGVRDFCTCRTPNYHSGPNCEISNCYGLYSNQSAVCSGNGKCINTDSCVCDIQWKGTLCNMKNFTLLQDPGFYAATIIPGSIVSLCLLLTFSLWLGCCINSALKNSKRDVDEIQIAGKERSWKRVCTSIHFVNMVYNIIAIAGFCLGLLGISLQIYQINAKDVFQGSIQSLSQTAGIMWGFGLVIMCCCWPCYWGLIATSSTGKYLLNIRGAGGLVDKVQQLRNTNPYISLRGESWHFETRTRTVYKDHYINGRFSHTTSHTETETIRVSTGTWAEQFVYSQCIDSSNDLNSNIVQHNLVKVNFTKSWFYGDKNTENVWNVFQQNFKYKYDHDTHFSMNTHFDINGFEEKILSVADRSKLPFWFNSITFYVTSCCCCCLWPWSCWLDTASVKSSYQVVKTIYA